MKKLKYGNIDCIDRKHIRLRIYPNKILKDYEIKNDNIHKNGCRTNKTDGEIGKRSLYRTQNTIKKLVSFNDDKFNTFITLTFKDDVENIDEAFKYFQSYIKYCKRHLNEELYYICVPEIQQNRAKKTGKFVIHFHIITNINLDSELIPRREPKKTMGKNKTIKTLYYYDLPGWSHGYSFAIGIDRNSTFNLSLYLIKYLYKDFDNRFFNRQKLLKSNNLKCPSSDDIYSKQELDHFMELNKDKLIEVYGSKKGINGKYIEYQDYIYEID